MCKGFKNQDTKMEDLYFAIYRNGKSTSFLDWEKRPKGKEILYLKRCNFDDRNTYEYQFLDSNACHYDFSKGTFEIVRIRRSLLNKSPCINIDMIDKRLETLYHDEMLFPEDILNVDKLYERITELITNLNLYGSWIAYQNSLKIKELEKELKSLRDINKQLRNECLELKQNISNLK